MIGNNSFSSIEDVKGPTQAELGWGTLGVLGRATRPLIGRDKRQSEHVGKSYRETVRGTKVIPSSTLTRTQCSTAHFRNS